MRTPEAPGGGARRSTRGPVAALVALGAWTIAVPYLARPLGLAVDVAASIEVVDHVVPGLLVALAGGWLAWRGRGDPVGPAGLVASGICVLAGFWVLATHVPLLRDAADGREPWAAALWHFSTALPIISLGFFTALRSGPAEVDGA